MGRLKIYDDSGKLQNFDPSGNTTAADVNATDSDLTVAQIVGGIILHTSDGAGTVTVDTAAHIIPGYNGKGELKNIGDTIRCFYINDGDNALTFAVATGLTIADVGQTIGANESAILVFRKVSATAVKMYIIGA